MAGSLLLTWAILLEVPELGRQAEEQSGAQLGLLLPQGARPQHPALVGREGQVRDRGQAADLLPGEIGGEKEGGGSVLAIF